MLMINDSMSGMESSFGFSKEWEGCNDCFHFPKRKCHYCFPFQQCAVWKRQDNIAKLHRKRTTKRLTDGLPAIKQNIYS